MLGSKTQLCILMQGLDDTRKRHDKKRIEGMLFFTDHQTNEIRKGRLFVNCFRE